MFRSLFQNCYLFSSGCHNYRIFQPHLVTNGEAVMSESKASPLGDDVFGVTSTTKRKDSGDSASTTKKDSEGARTIKVEEHSNGNEASTSSTGQHMEMIIHNIKKEEEDENVIFSYHFTKKPAVRC